MGTQWQSQPSGITSRSPEAQQGLAKAGQQLGYRSPTYPSKKLLLGKGQGWAGQGRAAGQQGRGWAEGRRLASGDFHAHVEKQSEWPVLSSPEEPGG